MTPKTLVDVVLWLETLFDHHGMDRSYGGAIARNFYAPPRFTKDVDVLVLASQLKLPALIEEFRSAGCAHIRDSRLEPIDLKQVLDQIRSRSHMTSFLCFEVEVEIFVPWHPFHTRVLRDSPSKDLEGHAIKVHAPEDLIVFKKIFDRSKDIEDIKALLVANIGKLDLQRIRQNARELIEDRGYAELEELIRDFYR